MRVVGEVNKYVTDQAPYKLKDDSERDRLATILHVVVQAVHDCNLILSPFLPFSANLVDQALGGSGEVAPMPRIEEVDDLDGGPGYPVITGDYTGAPTWQRHRVVVGQHGAEAEPDLHQARRFGRHRGAGPARHRRRSRERTEPRRAATPTPEGRRARPGAPARTGAAPGSGRRQPLPSRHRRR